MNKTLVVCLLSLSTSIAHAAQEDVHVAKLKVGEATVLLFLNPKDEPAKTLLYCVDDLSAGAKALSDPIMGGIMLLRGSAILIKVHRGESTGDSIAVKEPYAQFICE